MTVKVTSSVSAASLETAAVKAKGRPCATDGAALGLSRTETAARARLGRLSAAAAAAQASAKARLLLVDLRIFLSRPTCPPPGPAGPRAGADRPLAGGLRGRVRDPRGPARRAVLPPRRDRALLPDPAPAERRRDPARRR